MLKYRNLYCYLVLLTTACFNQQALAQKKSLPDSLCSLKSVDKKIFTAYINARTKDRVNKLNNTSNNEILYLVYTKQTGEYNGASLQLNDAGKVVKSIRFAYNIKKGFTFAEQKWSNDDLNLKSLFADSACYMNRFYKTDGTDELLLYRRNGIPVNGLVYNGCSSTDPGKETLVQNKTYLQLLPRLRKNF
jgi:hypothetical protein